MIGFTNTMLHPYLRQWWISWLKYQSPRKVASISSSFIKTIFSLRLITKAVISITIITIIITKIIIIMIVLTKIMILMFNLPQSCCANWMETAVDRLGRSLLPIFKKKSVSRFKFKFWFLIFDNFSVYRFSFKRSDSTWRMPAHGGCADVGLNLYLIVINHH